MSAWSCTLNKSRIQSLRLRNGINIELKYSEGKKDLGLKADYSQEIKRAAVKINIMAGGYVEKYFFES